MQIGKATQGEDSTVPSF